MTHAADGYKCKHGKRVMEACFECDSVDIDKGIRLTTCVTVSIVAGIVIGLIVGLIMLYIKVVM